MRPPFNVIVASTIHSRIIAASGGSPGVRDRGILASSLTAPFQTFGGDDLIPGIVEKAAALAFGIIRNHPFVDGNKRTAYVLMKTLLLDHRLRLTATEDERENALVSVADGSWSAERFTAWLQANVSKRRPEPSLQRLEVGLALVVDNDDLTIEEDRGREALSA